MEIGIIGCGNMGTAFIKQLSQSYSLHLCDRKKKHAQKLAETYGCKAIETMEEVAAACDVIFLAVKPKDFNELAKMLEAHVKKEALIVSMLAGVSYEMLKMHFSVAKPLRIMPNLPVHAGRGVIGVEDDVEFTEEFRERVRSIFSHLGSTYFVSEKELDGFVALTGGGPAFACVFLEGLIEAGIKLGFKAPLAKELAEKTVEGTIALLEKEGMSTQAFRFMNCSPGGTTIEGIEVLESSGLRGIVMEACQAAYEKAFQLH